MPPASSSLYTKPTPGKKEKGELPRLPLGGKREGKGEKKGGIITSQELCRHNETTQSVDGEL